MFLYFYYFWSLDINGVAYLLPLKEHHFRIGMMHIKVNKVEQNISNITNGRKYT